MTPEKPHPPGVRELDLGDADVALLEDAIFSQQALKVIADQKERITKRPNVVEELRRQGARQTATAATRSPINLHLRTS